MPRPVYTASSVYAFCESIAVRILALIGFMWLFKSYHENPLLILIVMILSLLVFFYWGNEEILLYEDRLVIRSTSLACLIFSSGYKQWMLKDIQQVVVPEGENPKAMDMAIMTILSFFTRRNREARKNPFSLRLKDGTVLELSSEASVKKLSLLSDKANALLIK